MKLHTAVKYLRSLSDAPDRDARSGERFRALCAALGEAYGVRLPSSSALAVCGRGSAYAASVLARAMRDSSLPCAVLTLTGAAETPDRALSLGPATASEEETAQVLGAARSSAGALRRADGTLFSPPTAAEVLFASLLTLTARHGISHLILDLGEERLPPHAAALLPKPAVLLITDTSPDAVSALRPLTESGRTEEIIVTPQTEETIKTASELCAAVNCRMNVIIRSEIEAGPAALTGTPFSYRGFRAAADTQFLSPLGVSAAAAQAAAVLRRRGLGILPEAAAGALAATDTWGTGRLLALSPRIVTWLREVGEIRAPAVLAGDVRHASGPRPRTVTVLTDPENAADPHFGICLDALSRAGTVPDGVFCARDCPAPAAGVSLTVAAPLCDAVRAALDLAADDPDGRLILVCGSAAFLREAEAQIAGQYSKIK